MRASVLIFSFFSLFLWTALCPLFLYGQQKFHITQARTCNWSGRHIAATSISISNSTSPEADVIVEQICSYVGIKANFSLQASDGIPTAMAFIDTGPHKKVERWIVYNRTFMQNIVQKTGTYWSSVSVLAHEIAHHLNGHVLDNTPDRRGYELEADEFSGYILQKMHATLEQAQSAINTFNPRDDFGSHYPLLIDRLEAIARGWQKSLAQSQPNIDPEDLKFSYRMLSRFKTITDNNFCELLDVVAKSRYDRFETMKTHKVTDGLLSKTYDARISFKNCRVRITSSVLTAECTLTLYDGNNIRTANAIADHLAGLIEKCTGHSASSIKLTKSLGASMWFYTSPALIEIYEGNDAATKKWTTQVIFNAF